MSRFVVPPITALVYGSGSDPAAAMARIADHLASRGARCAGFIQRDVPMPGRSRCDMLLADVSSGATIAISEDRGAEARGCRLNESELSRAIMVAMQALESKPDLLLINKFGKSEAGGRGFLPLIAEAVERGIPLLIAVPWRNIESWRHFAGDLAREVAVGPLSNDSARLCAELGFVGGRDLSAVGTDSGHACGDTTS